MLPSAPSDGRTNSHRIGSGHHPTQRKGSRPKGPLVRQWAESFADVLPTSFCGKPWERQSRGPQGALMFVNSRGGGASNRRRTRRSSSPFALPPLRASRSNGRSLTHLGARGKVLLRLSERTREGANGAMRTQAGSLGGSRGSRGHVRRRSRAPRRLGGCTRDEAGTTTNGAAQRREAPPSRDALEAWQRGETRRRTSPRGGVRVRRALATRKRCEPSRKPSGAHGALTPSGLRHVREHVVAR